MKIIFFAHPLFLGSQSMPRFVNMLAKGMEARGHQVDVWRPEPLFSDIPVKGIKKWLGYMDQYLVFPQVVKRKLKKEGKDVLYVVTDHALGPYVPLIANQPHVVHCHDFLAQRSALGEIPENLTSASGQKYQAYIRNGYSKGKNFISVSEKTRTDLKEFLPSAPSRSEMVYNGLNPSFVPGSAIAARAALGQTLKMDLSNGYILHVGGNQWYKNREGVIAIYDQWRTISGRTLPLILIGNTPSGGLMAKYEASAWKKDIHFFSGLDDKSVYDAYTGATVFLFPSIAEGFGWPIAEAMASGTPVITTNEVPMLEVAGDAAFLIDRKPSDKTEHELWATNAAAVLNRVVTLEDKERDIAVSRGLANVQRFKLEEALDKIELIYRQVLNS